MCHLCIRHTCRKKLKDLKRELQRMCWAYEIVSGLDSANCSQRDWVRLCTWASKVDAYSASTSQQKGNSVKVNTVKVIGWHNCMAIGNLPQLSKCTWLQYFHTSLLKFWFLIQDIQIPEWVFFRDVFENSPPLNLHFPHLISMGRIFWVIFSDHCLPKKHCPEANR